MVARVIDVLMEARLAQTISDNGTAGRRGAVRRAPRRKYRLYRAVRVGRTHVAHRVAELCLVRACATRHAELAMVGRVRLCKARLAQAVFYVVGAVQGRARVCQALVAAHVGEVIFKESRQALRAEHA